MSDYKTHPAAEAFPMMSKQEFAELKNSMRDRGQREAIVTLDGMILDGRNRYKACQELGIKPKTAKLKNEESPWMWVWDQNAERRHIQAGTKASIRLNIEESDKEWEEQQERAKKDADAKRKSSAKGNTNASKENSSSSEVTTTVFGENKTRNARADKAGVSSGTMAKAETLKHNARDLHDAVASGKKSLFSAYKEYQQRKRADEQAKAFKSIDSSSIVVECRDFKTFIAENPCDVVITDPPYPKEYVHVYGELAKACAAAGVKVLAAMAGPSYLPQILQEMVAHMPYRWLIAYLTPGGQSAQVWDRKVNTFWKPIIVMGETPEEWMGDVAKSDEREKAHHHWGQSESGMADLIERLSLPGQTICDPFCGGGTTGVAALGLGRKFVGCDIDESMVKTTKGRLGCR